MTDRKQLTFHAAGIDAAYVGRFASGLALAGEKAASTAALCMYGYFSLFVHESYAKVKDLNPQLAQAIALSPDAQAAVRRSRHSLKLFDDKRGVGGLLSDFQEQIIKPSQTKFIDDIRLPFLKPLGRDLGIFTYDGLLVSTSHAASFALGLGPEALLGE